MKKEDAETQRLKMIPGAVELKPSGIFKDGTNGIFDARSPGEEVPEPSPEENRSTIHCDVPKCKEQLFWVADVGAHQAPTSVDVPIDGWLKHEGKDYCPWHGSPFRREAFLKKLGDGGFSAPASLPPLPAGELPELDTELSSAEAMAGVGSLPPRDPGPPPVPAVEPAPRAQRPARFPPLTGWWYALLILLIAAVAWLVMYVGNLKSEIGRYEFSLSLNNASSFEHNAAIQRVECNVSTPLHCSGLLISDAADLPVRYICDSTHCTFECAK